LATQANVVSYDQALTASRRLIGTSLAGAQQLERGQAELPLADYFHALEQDLSVESWTLCVVVAADAFASLVGWICGDELTQVWASTKQPGYLEIAFHGERFSLESTAGSEMFDSLEALLDALKPQPLVLDARPLQLSAPGQGRPPGLRLAVVVGGEQLGNDPGLCASLIGRSNALWLVGTQTWQWDDSTRQALRSLRAGMDFCCPILIGAAHAPTQSGWWTEILGGSRKTLLCLESSRSLPLPALLTEERSSLRRALRLMFVSRRARQGLDTLKERLELLRQQQRARRQREERTERTLGDGAAEWLIRGPLDTVRASLSDDIANLQKGLQEASRRSLAREGTLARIVDSLVQSVTPADVLQTPAGRRIALALDEAFTTRFGRELRQSFKEELRRDLLTLRDGLLLAGQNVQRVLQDSLAVSMPLDLPPPDERPIREALHDVLQVQLRYRGEIPKRGFVQRLGEGRRMLFAVIMTVSLFGSLLTGGRNVRTVLFQFGVVFILLFISAVLWTFRSWKREDQERLNKEIDKIREQVHAEAMRLVRDGERERLARLVEALEGVRKEALRRIDDFSRQITQQAAANQARERNAVRDRMRIIDQRAKELDQLRSTLQRAEQDATDMSRLADGVLRQALLEHLT
jgi:hypothetical protein